MFGDGEGLNTEIKFVVGAAFDAFSKAWGDLASEKIFWIDTWSELLVEYDVRTIGHATEHCIQTLTRSPTLPEFKTYCKRIKNKERLTDPIISKVEKIARNILETTPETLDYSNYSELADACLIAASIAAAKANESVGLEWNKNMVELDLAARARMFGFESLLWRDDARNGKGYWFDLLVKEKA